MRHHPALLLRAAGDAAGVLVISRSDGNAGPSLRERLLGPELPRPRSVLGWVGRWTPVGLATLLSLVVIVVLPQTSPVSQGWLALVSVVGLVLAACRPVVGWRFLLVWQVVLAVWMAATGQDTNPLLVVGVWALLPAVHGAVRLTSGAPRVGVIAWSTGLAWVCWALSAAVEGEFDVTVQAVVLIAVAVALGWSAGGLDRSKAHARAEQARAERSELGEAVLQERARIARELHDVVAHRVAVIAVRCESAPYRLQGVEEAVRRELAAVADDAREALRELHDVLSVLAAPQTSGGPGARAGTAGTELDRRPAPGVADLRDAVAGAVAAGAQVELHLQEEVVRCLGASQGLTIYRVVTQALANALEHAPGAAVDISVVLRGAGGDDGDPAGDCGGGGGREPRSVEVMVLNGPSREAVGSGATQEAGAPGAVRWGGGGPAVARRGTGIEGMRDRVGLHGGVLSTGPTPSGGYRVSAVLQLHARPPV